MVYKLSRQGKFMSCARFPDCTGARTEKGEVISNEPQKPIGYHPDTHEPIYVLSGRFGPFVQQGESKKGSKTKPRRASVPKEKNPAEITMGDALKYLSLPRVLGVHPDTKEPITANIGRFGPYVVHQADFRSLKQDNVYEIGLDRALEIFKEEKKKRGFPRKKKE